MKRYFLSLDPWEFVAGRLETKGNSLTGESKELTFEEFSELKNRYLLDIDNLKSWEVSELEENKSVIYRFEVWDDETEELEIYFTLEKIYPFR